MPTRSWRAVCAGRRLGDELVGRSLAAAAFPALPLSVNWTDELEQAVVQAFCAWQATLLLMLWNLEPTTRSQLEHAARGRAVLVQAYHRLYPVVVNESAIKAALVESVMRSAAKPSDACGKSSRTRS